MSIQKDDYYQLSQKEQVIIKDTLSQSDFILAIVTLQKKKIVLKLTGQSKQIYMNIFAKN